MTEAAGGRLLVFRVGDVACAAGTESVREILPTTAAARIPGAPLAVRGLMNVRGTLVPVVDGGLALTGETRAAGATTILFDHGASVVGLAVDQVLDLLGVEQAELAGSEAMAGVDPRVVRGVGRHAGLVFVVLDIDALIGPLFPS